MPLVSGAVHGDLHVRPSVNRYGSLVLGHLLLQSAEDGSSYLSLTLAGMYIPEVSASSCGLYLYIVRAT